MRLRREATASNLAINIKTDISTEGVEHFLRMVGPILDFQLDLQKKHELIDALHGAGGDECDLIIYDFPESETIWVRRIPAASSSAPQNGCHWVSVFLGCNLMQRTSDSVLR